MAKWAGEGKPPFTGTVDCLTIYQLPDGKWYVRMRSSITGKRIKKDPVFEGFRKSSFRMKDASPIASMVYQQLPVKQYKLFREMTGKALLWLKTGLTVKEITDKLTRDYIAVANKAPVKKRIPVKSLVKIPNPYILHGYAMSTAGQSLIYRALRIRYSEPGIRSPISS
jgi:hypothetical protein